MMKYEQATTISPMRDQVIHFFAVVGSLPLIPAKINISPETINAIVTIVPIKNVADKTIS